MRQKTKIGILIIALVGLSTVAQSQDAAEKAFMDVKMKMHESMPVEYTGDPDVEFVRSMIPHHQGAIDMAEVELKYGKDPQARTFAEKIIKAQKAEIEQLNEWLKQHGK
jgi:uncharacterized protein (DUF305 family)